MLSMRDKKIILKLWLNHETQKKYADDDIDAGTVLVAGETIRQSFRKKGFLIIRDNFCSFSRDLCCVPY